MSKNAILFVLALTLSFFIINNFLFPPQEYSPPPPELRKERVVEESEVVIPIDKGESLFVLESPYQQLVFSSRGGALAEINLPLKNKENPQSVVREISVDRVLEKDYPQNDQFPLKSYQTFTGDNLSPVTGNYYPLLRRGIDPKFYSMATLSESAEIAETIFKVKRWEKNLIEFEGNTKQGKITKTFSFPEDPHTAPYCFDLTVSVEGGSGKVYVATGVPDVELVSGTYTPILKYRFTKSGKPGVKQADLPKNFSYLNGTNPDWICNSNGFLAVILDPLTEHTTGFGVEQIPGEQIPSRLCVIDTQYDLYPPSKYPGYNMRLPLSEGSSTTKFRVYAGPLTTEILAKVDKTYTDPFTKSNPDYMGSISFHGWFAFISEPFAKFLFFLMKIFYSITHSWGISIILLTAALRLIMYPLNGWSIKTTLNTSLKMASLGPKVAQIQAKYKKEPRKIQMETAALYKQHGINPLGGCLPSLIQMPFLIGMWDLLKSTFQLRGASFIPGWINNLSAPDVVFSWSYPIWFVGTSFHLLPLILAGVMFVQQQLASTLPKDKKLWTDQQLQQKFMGNLMSLLFAIFFYNLPSGLNIYWIFSTLFGIAQQTWVTKKLKMKS